MCHRDKIVVVQSVPLWVSFLFVMSDMAFAFWGPFQAMSHISNSVSRGCYINNTHIYKGSPFGPVHQKAAIV